MSTTTAPASSGARKNKRTMTIVIVLVIVVIAAILIYMNRDKISFFNKSTTAPPKPAEVKKVVENMAGNDALIKTLANTTNPVEVAAVLRRVA
ncbi:MAG: hypothetical protein V4506_19215 [Bacteroidota bacterium]